MLEVFKFECRYQLRSPLFLVLAIVWGLFAFLIMAADNVQLGGVGNNLNYNAAWTIVYMQFFFSLIGMLAAVAIVSQAITRDYELKSAEMMFATGVSERAFLLGRFFGAGLFAMLVGVAAILGTMLGTLMPWLDAERVGPFTLVPYLYALVVVTVPNFFFSSALFFTLAALTRSMLGAFIGAVGFMVLYIVIGNLVDPEQIDVFAMFDPFGQTAFGEVSRYWTVFERNAQLVPVTGALLFNRLLWIAIGVAALLFTLWRYGFTLNPSPFRRRRSSKTAEAAPPVAALTVTQNFDWRTPFRQFRSQVRIDLQAIYKSVPFYVILGFAALNVSAGFASASGMFGTPLLPVTGAQLRTIASNYTFFILIVLIYYAGEIVHRERQAGVADVIDGAPFPNIVMIASKIASLWFIVLCLLLFAMGAAIVNQLLDGYTNFELGLYLQSLLFVMGGFFFLFAVFAVFIQVLTGNKWLGMVGALTVLLVFQSLPSFDYQHGLYNFGPTLAPHSDMNGYGHFWQPLVAFTLYWTLFCALLAIASHLLFPRGRVLGFAERVRQGRARAGTRVLAGAGVALAGFIGCGAWIFWNTNVVNTYRTTDTVEAQQAAYEKTYKGYELMPRPEVVAVDSEVDLYPAERRLESRGSARLVNRTDAPITELFVSTHPLLAVNALGVPGATLREQNETMGVRLYDLTPPLAPGAEMVMTWDATWRHDGFANPNEAAVTGGASNRVVANGTFVNNTEIMPYLGYNSGVELSDPTTRREYDLAPIVRLPELGDPAWLGVSQFGVGERAAFRTVFSTSADQTAVAPGYLVGEVEERDGRRFFTYEMDEPIWPFFAFVSARYEVARDEHEGVAIEVYHHAGHPYNIEPMIRGTKKSLSYFNEAFSPYQYRQFRILEFPRYASFAQSFPNTIPYSEAIGFVADLRDEDALDLVFYVTAHELAHQWWAHQVVGARMQGMTVIVETLAQYGALMVMEREYGPDKMRRFLRYELDRYLLSRGGELIDELPLMLTENQQYIHYQKGSLVMYALKDLIGEERVNLALRNFIAEFGYVSGAFPTTRDLIDALRAVAEPEHQAMITDLFERIALYDFAVADATVEEVDGEWEVRFTARAAKFYADGKGVETEAPLEAWVDIAVFPAAEEELDDYQLPAPLIFEKRLVTTGEKEVVLRVADKPARVGIDPYNKLIDRNPEDNLKFLTD